MKKRVHGVDRHRTKHMIVTMILHAWCYLLCWAICEGVILAQKESNDALIHTDSPRIVGRTSYCMEVAMDFKFGYKAIEEREDVFAKQFGIDLSTEWSQRYKGDTSLRVIVQDIGPSSIAGHTIKAVFLVCSMEIPRQPLAVWEQLVQSAIQGFYDEQSKGLASYVDHESPLVMFEAFLVEQPVDATFIETHVVKTTFNDSAINFVCTIQALGPRDVHIIQAFAYSLNSFQGFLVAALKPEVTVTPDLNKTVVFSFEIPDGYSTITYEEIFIVHLLHTAQKTPSFSVSLTSQDSSKSSEETLNVSMESSIDIPEVTDISSKREFKSNFSEAFSEDKVNEGNSTIAINRENIVTISKNYTMSDEDNKISSSTNLAPDMKHFNETMRDAFIPISNNKTADEEEHAEDPLSRTTSNATHSLPNLISDDVNPSSNQRYNQSSNAFHEDIHLRHEDSGVDDSLSSSMNDDFHPNRNESYDQPSSAQHRHYIREVIDRDMDISHESDVPFLIANSSIDAKTVLITSTRPDNESFHDEDARVHDSFSSSLNDDVNVSNNQLSSSSLFHEDTSFRNEPERMDGSSPSSINDEIHESSDPNYKQSSMDEPFRTENISVTSVESMAHAHDQEQKQEQDYMHDQSVSPIAIDEPNENSLATQVDHQRISVLPILDSSMENASTMNDLSMSNWQESKRSSHFASSPERKARSHAMNLRGGRIEIPDSTDPSVVPFRSEMETEDASLRKHDAEMNLSFIHKEGGEISQKNSMPFNHLAPKEINSRPRFEEPKPTSVLSSSTLSPSTKVNQALTLVNSSTSGIVGSSIPQIEISSSPIPSQVPWSEPSSPFTQTSIRGENGTKTLAPLPSVHSTTSSTFNPRNESQNSSLPLRLAPDSVRMRFPFLSWQVLSLLLVGFVLVCFLKILLQRMRRKCIKNKKSLSTGLNSSSASSAFRNRRELAIVPGERDAMLGSSGHANPMWASSKEIELGRLSPYAPSVQIGPTESSTTIKFPSKSEWVNSSKSKKSTGKVGRSTRSRESSSASSRTGMVSIPVMNRSPSLPMESPLQLDPSAVLHDKRFESMWNEYDTMCTFSQLLTHPPLPANVIATMQENGIVCIASGTVQSLQKYFFFGNQVNSPTFFLCQMEMHTLSGQMAVVVKAQRAHSTSRQLNDFVEMVRGKVQVIAS